MANPAAPAQPEPVPTYAMFSGGIDSAGIDRFVRNIAFLSNPLSGPAHILFQSNGGTVGDGVFLYNFFRACPNTLTVYNGGTVASIAAIAYLGAPHRRVSAYASFMLHRSTLSPQAASARRLEVATQMLTIDDARTEAILRQHLRLTEDQWAILDHHDLTLSAQQAVDVGLADEVADFAPPTGTHVFAIL